MLGLAPFLLPPVITALGFLTFWATLGAYGQPWTAMVSHAIFFVTLPLVTLTLGFASIDRALVEAAATMGANDRTILRTIVLPLIRPYLISGFAFAFVLSLNEYIVAYMAVGFTMETLPIKIFNSLRYGYTPTMAAVSVLFVAAAAVIFAARRPVRRPAAADGGAAGSGVTYITAPTCDGTNSLSPRPRASLFVRSPEVTRRTCRGLRGPCRRR